MASLEANVSTSLDTSADIIKVTAADRDAGRAAQLANGVAETFLSVRAGAEQAQLAHQQALLMQKLSAAQAAGSTGLVTALEQQIRALPHRRPVSVQISSCSRRRSCRAAPAVHVPPATRCSPLSLRSSSSCLRSSVESWWRPRSPAGAS